ncbi:protein disulfide-isomerase domain-containing protein, variant 1 [Trichophyton rubrum CBS 100081]|nr:protein disulfide-isomerase domain-containing protein, variant 1 [Trichophyton rubrum CBS 100081]
MRRSLFFLSVLAASISPVFGLPSEQTARSRDEAEKPLGPDPKSTVFNGVTVPPMKELRGPDFEESIKEDYWFVKHYHPDCGHCKAVAPIWQTLYEFYYTSNPLLSATAKKAADNEKSLNSFHGYYGFHFASLNCAAYADKCKELSIVGYPRFVLYHKGKPFDTFSKENKGMQELSSFIEEKLEMIKPGSRPQGGVNLPKPGDKEGQMILPDKDKAEGNSEPEKPIKGDSKVSSKGSGDRKGSKDTKTPQDPKDSKSPKGDKIPAQVPTPKKEAKEKKYNLSGSSVSLTAESFLKLVTTTQDPWFIKFYAPWCSHCQALAPVWQQMAKDMKGKLNVGEVNCEAERRLCKEARISSYPTMHFFRGGEKVQYEGLRGLGDLVNYANKATDVVGLGVQYVDAEAFKKMEETEEVIFLYFFDHATTSEDFAALDRLTLSLVGHARLVKTDSKELAERFRISTWPRLLVARDGTAKYYTALAPRDMRDFRAVLSWMQSVWLPIVPELTATNARDVMDGKYVVLGILNRQHNEDFVQNKRELKNAALEWMEKQTKLFQLERQELRDAKDLRIEEADDRNDQRALRAAKSMRITIREDDKKQVGFAWVDGIFWDRWVKTTFGVDVKNGDRVIIHDESNRRYWDSSPNGVDIMPSRTSILETLTHIAASSPKLKSKSTVGFFEHIFFTTRTFVSSHPFITLALCIVAIAIASLWAKRQIRRTRTVTGKLGGSSMGFFHLDGKEKGLFSSVGSGPSNGKVD